jgi:serine phosphatase RsbU (regulator of sigma subunit)
MSILPAGEALATSAKRPRILVVDDDAAALRLLALWLSSSGFDVETASSGEDALRAVSNGAPELVVLDFDLPGCNGAEVCAGIRNAEAEQSKNLPIIMLTAYAGETEEIRCLDAGANDFVSKPVSAAVLHARILTQLRLRSHARQLEEWNRIREADLACARSMQQGLVPQTMPVLRDWEVQAKYVPLLEVGGDMYGWEPLADGRCLFWLADGIGHGAAAALVTALTAHLFSKAAELAVSPSEVLARVNREFVKAMAGKTFMTACCAIVADDGSVIFASVGQPPLLVRRRDGSMESFPSDKAMLGVDPNLKPDENAVSLSEGDTLLLYTDGLFSLRNKKGEKFGPQVVEKVAGAGELGAQAIEDIFERIRAQSDGSPVFDDLAAIALRRLE